MLQRTMLLKVRWFLAMLILVSVLASAGVLSFQLTLLDATARSIERRMVQLDHLPRENMALIHNLNNELAAQRQQHHDVLHRLQILEKVLARKR